MYTITTLRNPAVFIETRPGLSRLRNSAVFIETRPGLSRLRNPAVFIETRPGLSRLRNPDVINYIICPVTRSSTTFRRHALSVTLRTAYHQPCWRLPVTSPLYRWPSEWSRSMWGSSSWVPTASRGTRRFSSRASMSRLRPSWSVGGFISYPRLICRSLSCGRYENGPANVATGVLKHAHTITCVHMFKWHLHIQLTYTLTFVWFIVTYRQWSVISRHGRWTADHGSGTLIIMHYSYSNNSN